MYERIRVNTLPGYENVLDIYTVDKYGNVYGKNGNEVRKYFNQADYFVVGLNVNGKKTHKRALVHRLVALAFVNGRTDEFNEVDHIDTNKLNNNYWNLRWTNRIGNMANPLTKIKMLGCGGVSCYVYDFLLNYIGYYECKTYAENDLNITVKKLNTRVGKYYILEKPDLNIIPIINRKQKLQSIVITNIETHAKKYFYSNREARRFFDNKVNITQAIQKNWTVRGKYKVRNLNYKKLIGMLDL